MLPLSNLIGRRFIEEHHCIKSYLQSFWMFDNRVHHALALALALYWYNTSWILLHISLVFQREFTLLCFLNLINHVQNILPTHISIDSQHQPHLPLLLPLHCNLGWFGLGWTFLLQEAWPAAHQWYGTNCTHASICKYKFTDASKNVNTNTNVNTHMRVLLYIDIHKMPHAPLHPN